MPGLIDAINKIQEINSRVSEMVYCPPVEDYPSGALDTMVLPIALTDIESGTFTGSNGDRQADDQIVIRVLFESLGQSDLGPNKAFGLRLYHAYRDKYLADATYSPLGTRIIMKSPYRTSIQLPFSATAFGVIEYPTGAENWFHGFEIRFTLHSEWDIEDC